MRMTTIFITDMHGLSNFHILHQKRNSRINQDWQSIGHAVRHTIFLCYPICNQTFQSLDGKIAYQTQCAQKYRTNLHVHPTRIVAGLFILDRFILQPYVASGSKWP